MRYLIGERPTPLVAFNPQDHFVVTMANRILVITNAGAVFGHDIDGNTIAPDV
ncbi:MAG: hypothetical protein LC808_38485 [Actinobacteria bacterium]|nr:hypothetical protein [Actinomycetota bacterium]